MRGGDSTTRYLPAKTNSDRKKPCGDRWERIHPFLLCSACFSNEVNRRKTMHAKLTSRPVDQVIAAIQALDLEPIRLRVMDAELGEGWTREFAESAERAYRTYLTMLVKHPEKMEDIVVSKDVDEFWHTHILHTMKYTEDCERVFGKYLHHNPHVGERTRADVKKKAAQVEETRRIYQREFGDRQDYNAAWSGISVKAENAVM